jgi:hypothetical protein
MPPSAPRFGYIPYFRNLVHESFGRNFVIMPWGLFPKLQKVKLCLKSIQESFICFYNAVRSVYSIKYGRLNGI